MAKTDGHKWEFKARFRTGAFGWRSQTAVGRVKQAVSEIKRVARKDKVLAAEGAVLFLERVSPALVNVDSSSGAIGTAVNHAVDELVKIITAAEVGPQTRQGWLERLYEAHAEQAMSVPYIDTLAEYWGEICASPEVASRWADDMLPLTHRVLGPGRRVGDYYHAAEACLNCLYHAGRYQEIVDLVSDNLLWHYRQWVALALAALGRKAEAVRYAESCRGPYASDSEIDRFCEKVLLSSGMVEEAYCRYGLTANQRPTYLATFRAVAGKYPHKRPAEILADLVATTPGSEGKWFAAAKEAGLCDEALALAADTPADPLVLSRAARDYAETKPAFAVEAGLLALRWLAAGYGYEITWVDVVNAYDHTMKAAERLGAAEENRQRIRQLLLDGSPVSPLVRQQIGPKVGMR